MSLINLIIGNEFNYRLKTVWYKSIFIKTSLLAWGLIILTLFVFIIGTLPYQRNVLEERMKSEANDIAGSIGQVTANAIINNDNGFIIDHCLKIIQQSKSILYITIVRNDGVALVFCSNSWLSDTLKDELSLPRTKDYFSKFVYSDLVKQNVFHYSYPFSYSEIDWGRINVGLSLKNFDQNAYELYFRTIFLALISIIFGFIASIYFAKRITKPILQLDNVSQKVAHGDLNARVNISAENEIGRLAESFNKMTESLKSSQDNLERKVEQRTSELEKINKVLQIEISEKLLAENRLKQYNSRLESLDKIYRGIISAKSVEQIINETISNLNDLFPSICLASVALFDSKSNGAQIFSSGFNNYKIKGLEGLILPIEENCSLFGKDEEINNFRINDLSELIEKRPFEKKLYESGMRSLISAPLAMDEEKIGVIHIASNLPLAFNEENKEVLLVVANQLAVAIFQAQLQVKIREHSESLQNSLSEKEVLLKEIHHRVKNNLQVISSLLYLNSKKIKDKGAQDMFKESQNRVKSIALVHERLYQSKDLGKIDFKEYVTRLTDDLFRSYAVNQSIIKLIISIKQIFISIDTAVPCGLIINEIISNSLKYAFPDAEELNKNCEIRIEFERDDKNNSLLSISDNGIGLPEGIDLKKTKSLGLQLVDTLIDQLEGTLEIDLSTGTKFKFKFKDINT
ncbi:MAG: histidine kinase dimerization/phosphoacceptor domain -containing protein [Ignavibacteriaceae bacterium]